MAYIGRSTDKISNIEILDNITFDGSSSYSITKSSVAFVPNSAQSLLISIDGVVQATNFTVSSSTIDFGVAIPSTSTCDFFLHYGTGLITTPADGTVTNDKINYPLAKSGATVSTFNRTTSDGTILELQKDGTGVGSIGVKDSSFLYLGNGDTGLKFTNTTDAITPADGSTGTGRNNAIDLGNSSNRFKDLYLGGGLYVGGTGTANKLDDYEEGTWTPTMNASGSGAITLASSAGLYTKIGNLVQLFCIIDADLSSESGTYTFGGFPFNAEAGGTLNYRYAGTTAFQRGTGITIPLMIQFSTSTSISIYKDTSTNQLSSTDTTATNFAIRYAITYNTAS